jgi:ATP-dependent Clp protease ATP-binding subunit ClpB
VSPFGLQLGTRPLKRATQRLIQDPLAMKLLDGEVLPGDPKKCTMTFARAPAKTARG